MSSEKREARKQKLKEERKQAARAARILAVDLDFKFSGQPQRRRPEASAAGPIATDGADGGSGYVTFTPQVLAAMRTQVRGSDDGPHVIIDDWVQPRRKPSTVSLKALKRALRAR